MFAIIAVLLSKSLSLFGERGTSKTPFSGEAR